MKPDSLFNGAAANPQGFNLYSYVKGNPVNFNDPMGHKEREGDPDPPNGDPNPAGPEEVHAQAMKDLLGGGSAGHLEGIPGGSVRNLWTRNWFRLGHWEQGPSNMVYDEERDVHVVTPTWVWVMDVESLESFLPDYLTGSVNIAVPTPWTIEWLSVTFRVSVDRYGKLYVGPGLSIGKGNFTGISASATPGWLDQINRPGPDKIESFLSGNSISGTAGVFVGGSESWTPGSGLGTEVGIVTPQLGVGWTYSWVQKQLPISW